MTLINNIFLENTFIINIQENETYKNACKVLDRFGFEYERFPAYIHKISAYGLTKSNLEIIKHAKKKNLDYVIICEDDLYSDVQDEKTIIDFQQKVKKYFDYEWDIMVLETTLEKYKKIDDNAIYIKGCLASAFYIVKKKSYDKMITILNNLIHTIKKKGKIYHQLDAIDSRYRYLMNIDKLKTIGIIPRIFYQNRIELISSITGDKEDDITKFYYKVLSIDKENGFLNDIENLKKWKSFLSLPKNNNVKLIQ